MLNSAVRKVICILTICIMLVSFGACSQTPATSENETTSTSSAGTTKNEGQSAGTVDNSPKVLTLLGFLKPGGDSPREKGAGELLKVFTEKTGYTLECEIVGWEQVEQKLLIAVESGDPPDVTFVRSQSLSIEANANALLPLDSYIEKDFDQATRDDYLLWDQIGMYKGTKYTLPMSIIPYGLYVRDDIYKANNISEDPKTWDDMINVAKKIKTNESFGFLFWGSAAQPAAIDYLQPIVEGFGGKLIDENEKGVFNSPEAMEGFKLIKRLVYDGDIVPDNIASIKYDEASDMFTSGRASMYIDGAHRFSKYAGGIGAENLRLVKIPGPTADKPSPSFVSYWSLGIPANSKNPDIAWEYIKNFTTPENQVTYSKISGEVAVRKSSLEDTFFKEDANGQRIKWFIDYVAERGTVAIAPVQFNKLSEILSLAVQEIISSPDSNVEEIVNKACEEYNKAIS